MSTTNPNKNNNQMFHATVSNPNQCVKRTDVLPHHYSANLNQPSTSAYQNNQSSNVQKLTPTFLHQIQHQHQNQPNQISNLVTPMTTHIDQVDLLQNLVSPTHSQISNTSSTNAHHAFFQKNHNHNHPHKQAHSINHVLHQQMQNNHSNLSSNQSLQAKHAILHYQNLK